MENRQLARLLGSLSFEERLRIIGALISAIDAGLTQHELAEITGLSPSAVWIHLDYMMGNDVVKSRNNGLDKIYLANLPLLEDLFLFMNENYGVGVRLANRAASMRAKAIEPLT
jgi:hypothetical protein